MSKGLPKLSDEFKPRAAIPRLTPRLGGNQAQAARAAATEQAARPASEQAGDKPVPASERPASERRPQPVERPAPMAPRLPPRPVAAQAPAQRPTASAQPPQAVAQHAPPREAARPAASSSAQNHGEGPQPRPATPQQPAIRAQQSPSRQAGSVDEFGERLRAQREAAERLVQQRLAAARQKSAQAASHSSANGEHAPRPEKTETPAPSTERPRFTFADEEIAAAKRETPTAPSAPSFSHVSPPPYVPSAATYNRAVPRLQESGRPGESFARRATSAASAYAPPKSEPVSPYRTSAAAAAVPAPAPVEPVLAREPEAAQPPRVRQLEGERRTLRRGANARQPDFVEDDLDEVFEEERPAARRGGRARAADYSAAYRGYEDDYEDDEPRRRSGPVILLLSLLAVAAIAGGLIYWYKQQQPTTAAPATGDVPVVTAPQEPVKASPEPQQQAVQQPQGRKQIYDRILGEETLEPERIAPTEEQPQQQLQAPVAEQPQVTVPQAPAAKQGQSVDPQGTQQDGQALEPLPLPLPPPPGTGEQGQLLSPSTQPAPRADNLQVPEPAASVVDNPAATRRADAPVAEIEDAETSTVAEEPAPEVAKPKAQRAEPAAASKPKKQAEKRVVKQPEPVASGNGPVQIAPIPLAPQSTDQTATLGVQSQPQPEALQSEPQAQPNAAPRRSKGEEDPLAGFRTTPGTGTNFNIGEPGGVGKIASTNVDAAQPTLQPAVQTIEEPSPAVANQAFEAQQQTARQLTEETQQPAPRQQVAVAQPPAAAQESTGSGYVVQLASFRSEADALSEFQRLSQRHPNLVGNMSSSVQRSDLGASGTFYRLGVGPLASKDAAAQLCNSLIAAGEKDCLVRRR